MGDLLFAIANLARKLGIEPESALRKANEKFTARFERLERAFEARGRSIHDATLEEMEAEWAALKSTEIGLAPRPQPRQPLSRCTRRRLTRRSEGTKKRRRKRGPPAEASRSGAGRRPATEVMRDS